MNVVRRECRPVALEIISRATTQLQSRMLPPQQVERTVAKGANRKKGRDA